MKANNKTINQNSDQFQVALLMDDIQEAKNISDALRELGVFAHYYEDLDEMWVSLNAYTPGFSIIDVKKLSQGSLQLKQHPKIKSHALKMAFYYKDTTKVLLSSTKGMDHYGLICAEVDLVEQIRSALHRRNEELRLLEEVETLQNRVSRLKVHGVKLTEKQEAQHYKLEQLEDLTDLIRNIGKLETQQEFYQRVLHVFSNWDSCLEFGIYYLNNSKQKLVSPKGMQKGYKMLPDLWLSETNEQGIDQYAQEMANDVCYGEIEGNLINLRVEGLFKGPDLLIWGKFDKKSTRFFQWDLLEEKLNSEYRKIILLENELVKSGQIFSAHHLLFELDEIQFHKAEGKYRYALVDFSRLLSMVRQRPKLRFNWKQFYQDLQSEISQNLQGTHYRLTTLTPGHFVLSLPRESIEKDFARLSAYIKDIEVWRYFNESNMLMNFDISPEVRIVSPASVNIIRQLEDGYIDIMDNTSSRRSRPGPSPSV